MRPFRFIHAADIHLDSPLTGLAGYEGPAVECIRRATRQAFDNLISEAIDQEVGFVLIAGDLYDGDWRDYQTGLFFIRQMGRLAKVNIPAFVLHGNHDAESQITRRLTLPEGVNVFSTRKPETFTLEELGVALHGQSFRQRNVTDNLVPAYPEPVEGAFNIGILHTGMGGMGGHANYAPCALHELVAKGYDYWALGHVHQGVILHQNPHVVFPGNLQGRHIRETGPKGAYLVSVEDHKIVELGLLYTDVVRWAHLQVNVDGCDRNADALERVRRAIEQAIESDADDRLLACRIELTGRTEIHDHLLISTEHLLAEAQAAALGFGDAAAWIERVVVSTEPVIDPAVLAVREDALGEFHRMLGDAAADTELLGQLEADLSELVRKLPSELRSDIEDAALKAAVQADYPTLITHVRGYLNARLTVQEG
ncbi:DNA repair exonuclease [Methylocystis sp.]|uniref:metallophosphoesterase family protein n=1 Tax=Methylocystis sp. TaxID=1911079 RepID=UPI0025D26008|nr:DNA repair exonuclease [Methylocystis sp.]